MKVQENFSLTNFSFEEIGFASLSSLDSSSIEIGVGIPTFCRHAHLRNALECLANQTFKRFSVYISNNNPLDKDELIEICKGYEDRFYNLVLYQQATNIGSLSNFNFLLRKSSHKYFMWAADDDLLSSNYIEELYHCLKNNKDAISAMGQWFISDQNDGFKKLDQMDMSSSSRLKRNIKFLVNPDDAIFYGLHKTEYLKNCVFDGYCWPNKGVVINWCYPYIFDLINQGRAVYSENAAFYNVINTEKHYTVKNNSMADKFIVKIFHYLTRKINIYIMYFKKSFSYNSGHFQLVFFFLLLFVMVWRSVSDVSKYTYRKLVRLF